MPSSYSRCCSPRSAVTITSNAAISAAFKRSPFSSCGGQLISTTVRTSCPARKPRTPTETFLSNKMRNAMALGVRQNRLNTILGQLELLRDFGHAYAVVEVIDNRVDWHSRAAQHGRAAQHARVDFNQGAQWPVDCLFRGHAETSLTTETRFGAGNPSRRAVIAAPPYRLRQAEACTTKSGFWRTRAAWRPAPRRATRLMDRKS